MKWSRAARWWPRSTAGRSPRTPARCCSARPIGRSAWSARFAACFDDGRAQAQVEHTVEAMVAQRVFGIALGYEDLIDHDQLRHDPVLATLAGKLDGPAQGLRAARRQEHAQPARARACRRRAATTRSATTARRSRACSSTCSSRRTRRRPRRSFSTSTPPTTRCTAIRKAASSTATTTATAICRCTCSAAGTCSRPSCGARTSTPRPAPSTRSRGSSPRSGRAGRGSRSCCGPIRALPATS